MSAWLDGYIATSLLARELGIESSAFRHTVLQKVKFKRTLLVKIPSEAVPFIQQYTAVLLDENENEEIYEYVLQISKSKKIGFWR